MSHPLERGAAWYATWFDTPYYHLLYANRDEAEARQFIRHLIDFIQPSPQARFLDLACGRGRHSIFLHQLGYNTTGVDLSQQSIAFAQQHLKTGLDFQVHDMREVFRPQGFEMVFNLFTSFGYFDDPADNLKVLKAVRENLVTDGCFILDFFNAHWVKKHIPHEARVVREDIIFHTSKRWNGQQIVKTIEFKDRGRSYTFQENVTAFTLAEFERLFQESGFRILHIFGDYTLGSYQEATSDRLILVVQPT
ncbi:MAG: class I SAM-dependent methyltransferase [Salibacteraceae bacterium]